MPLLALAYFGFISLGLPDGLLGVAWPSMAADYRVPLDALGFLTIAGMIGYFTSSVAAGFAIGRVGVGWLLAISTGLASLALTGYMSVPSMALAVVCALALALGSGAIDSGLNAYAATAFGPRHMNWLHAFFGLGVAIGPLIMTGVLTVGLPWRSGYGIVAVFQAGLAIAFALTVRLWARTAPTEAPRPAAPAHTLRIPAVWLGIGAFICYVAIEAVAGLWAYTVLTQGRDVSPRAAGLIVSAYWGALFAGRVIFGWVSERITSHRILVGALIGMAAGAALISLPAPAWVAAAGLVVVGFFAAPVFPLLILTTADRVGAAHADRAIGLQVGSSSLGAALVPALVGVLLNRAGFGWLGPVLLALSLLLVVLYLLASRPRAHGLAS
ncbi:MFS transporter [Catenuloplanes indicus]|uniref:Fucose permease n=1 Tax=Catenuloplanes indicus TaxID=137267 RepID=A0AAE3W746_9ACTN|nr:MFS transporter [Catenuloplanes indicus]MDQ0369772.1 fucose permease [Catenuloplanes indicus]